MNCYDCATEGRTVAAVGVCTTCNAGVCLSCAELETHLAPKPASVGNATVEATRALTCRSCERALRIHHHPYADTATSPRVVGANVR